MLLCILLFNRRRFDDWTAVSFLSHDVFDTRAVKSDQANAYNFPRDTTSTKGIVQNEQEMHSTLDTDDVLILR